MIGLERTTRLRDDGHSVSRSDDTGVPRHARSWPRVNDVWLAVACIACLSCDANPGAMSSTAVDAEPGPRDAPASPEDAATGFRDAEVPRLRAGLCEACALSTPCAADLVCDGQVGVCKGALGGNDVCTADCLRTGGCLFEGFCTAKDTGGKCTFNGGCIVGSDADCQQSELCQTSGQCALVGGKCYPGSDEDCQKTLECKQAGQCTFKDGWCVL